MAKERFNRSEPHFVIPKTPSPAEISRAVEVAITVLNIKTYGSVLGGPGIMSNEDYERLAAYLDETLWER